MNDLTDSRPIAMAMAVALLTLAGCASGPGEFPPTQPDASASTGGLDGKQLLETSAKRQGNDLRRHRRVDVAYDGRWTTFPRLTQAVLVDADFRGSSEERYEPGKNRVSQVHRGSGGEKTVRRVRPGTIEVAYNGEPDRDPEVEASAAFVADAYAMFLFGSSWLLKHGGDFRYLGRREIAGHPCDLVEVTLEPGLGLADRDRVVASIDAGSGLLRRVHFTMNGLESTRGAEVDVTFDDFLTAPDGSRWPGRFVEMIRRPVNARAHEWWTTSLAIDGKAVK